MTRFFHALFAVALLAFGPAAEAQFKVTGPAPYSVPVARQRIRALLEKADSTNQQQTIDTLNGLLTWYRDIIDDELIAAWQKDQRANLPEVTRQLADARVAAAVIDFSWRQQRQAAFVIAYAPMFEDMMLRFADSGSPMVNDLVRAAASGQAVDLTDTEAETVCRILLDMPDVGLWRKQANQILPFYRPIAQHLLAQDLGSSDQDRRERAQFWLYDPRSSLRQAQASTNTAPTPSGRRKMLPDNDGLTGTGGDVGASPGTARAQGAGQPSSVRPSPVQPSQAAQAAPATRSYGGPMSGTLECRGEAVPQNGEYVFRNLPPGNIKLVYDTRIWDARLAPGDGETQRLILKNKASGPQKKCSVRWSVAP